MVANKASVGAFGVDNWGVDNLGEDIAGTEISGGGAPLRTVKGIALLAETLGRFGFFAAVTIVLLVLIGRVSFKGISNVFGNILA